MNIVLLSGGSGKRLWPLSNEARSKQFIKIFKNGGNYESMVQRMYRGIKTIDSNSCITIATAQNQVSAIRNQLGNEVNISVEPCRRDTFPAIILATAYLKDVLKRNEDEAVVVCPVDPLVDEHYFSALQNLYLEAKEEKANLILMGIEPTYPSEKYGYILNSSFKEKPTKEYAEELISRGALWNGGVFAFKLKYVLDKAEELCGTNNYHELFDNYDSLPKISFDYAVAEHETSISVVKFSGQWKDLGTWNTLTEGIDENYFGNVVVDDTCKNVHIINELNMPVVAMGLNNIVIATSPDGILVADKQQSSFMKPIVDKLEQRPMYEERQWGDYKVIDYSSNPNSITKHMCIKPNHRLSYQKHFKRDEIWTIIDGEGEILIDNMSEKVQRGYVAYIKAGVKHSIKAYSELHFIEVQLGDDLVEEDIERYECDW